VQQIANFLYYALSNDSVKSASPLTVTVGIAKKSQSIRCSKNNKFSYFARRPMCDCDRQMDRQTSHDGVVLVHVACVHVGQ